MIGCGHFVLQVLIFEDVGNKLWAESQSPQQVRLFSTQILLVAFFRVKNPSGNSSRQIRVSSSLKLSEMNPIKKGLLKLSGYSPAFGFVGLTHLTARLGLFTADTWFYVTFCLYTKSSIIVNMVDAFATTSPFSRIVWYNTWK